MPLSAGDKLGPYEILSRIGAGGMGEVYKARDSRLNRTVAIKVLPDGFAQRDDLRQRFEREAKAVASLNHPHICVVHDFGEHGNTGYMVMEYLEGDTLAARLRKGALPVEQALRFGIEIAGALAQAHRKGVCHRDIKPGNIMLTNTGTKLLDFGLVKRLASKTPVVESTLTAGVTDAGAVLGTVPYMAPEQLEGKEADARTDIFALGVVLYEMATGRRPFTGEHAARLSAAILEQEPAPIPNEPVLNRVSMRCLAKKPDERWQSAVDLAEALRWAAEDKPAKPQDGGNGKWLYAAVAAGAVLCAVGLLYFRIVDADRPTPVIRATIQLPHAHLAGSAALAVSPDGMTIAYLSDSSDALPRRLFVRRLDSYAVRQVPGGEPPQSPCFSPDGAWIAFIDSKTGSVKKAPAAGGAPMKIGDYRLNRDVKEDPRGMPDLRATASWGADDWLYLGNRDGLQRLPASGGVIETLTKAGTSAEDRFAHDWPQLLPDGDSVLFTAVGESGGRPAILSVRTRQWQLIEHGPQSEWATVVPTGHLLTVQGSEVMATRVDLERKTLTGPAVPVVEGLTGSPPLVRIGKTGTLVYTGPESRAQDGALVWVDRKGTESQIRGMETGFINSHQRLSPDNRWIVALNKGIWKYDLAGQGRTLLSSLQAFLPIWRPDGAGVALTRLGQLYWLDASGGSEMRTLSSGTGGGGSWPSSWSPDGRVLAYQQMVGVSAVADIRVWHADGTDSAFLATSFNERQPEFSPKGNWIAYVSDQSGRDEVYLSAYPATRTPVVSLGRGNHPAWSPRGDEIFFLDGNRMMAVSVSAGNPPRAGTPQLLFEGNYLPAAVNMRNYDVSRDGQRFIMAKGVGTAKFDLNLVLNWFQELESLTGAKR